MNSPHEYVREIFDFMPRQTTRIGPRFGARLAAVPQALEGLRTSFMYAAEGGKVGARRQALACAESCDVWGQPDGAFGELATESESIDLGDEARGAARRSSTSAIGCATATPRSRPRATLSAPSATG